MTAYELANELSEFMTEDEYTELDKTIFKAVTMLRQQADRIAELEYDLKSLAKRYKALDRTKPLSDEEIEDLAGYAGENPTKSDMIAFAKAIEERHGIK